MKTSYVYALIDPRYDEVRYIGVTREPWTRVYAPFSEGRPWQSHVAAAASGSTHKDYWIRGLLQLKLKPVLVILDHGLWTDLELAQREIETIAFYKRLGANLLNKSGGGEQTPLWRMSDATRALISVRTREAMQDPAVRAKCSTGGQGRIPWNRSPDWQPPTPKLSDSDRRAVQAKAGREGSEAFWASMTPEDLREHSDKISVKKKLDWARITPEQRADRGAKMALGKRLAKAKRNGWILELINE